LIGLLQATFDDQPSTSYREAAVDDGPQRIDSTKPIAPMPWSQIRRAKYQCTAYDYGNEREKHAVTQKADRRDLGQDYEAASISHQDNEQCKSGDVGEEQKLNCKPNGVGDR
jgi:hypothetical protein